MNENYLQPPKPDIDDQDIIKGMYCLKKAKNPQVTLLGSGTIINEVLKAEEILRHEFDIISEIYSVTSYSELRKEALICDYDTIFRSKKKKVSHIEKCLKKGTKPVVAATDYVRLQADMIRTWVQRPYYVLGTDGFGRSDLRSSLRDHFAVSAKHIAWQALFALYQKGDFNADIEKVKEKLGINTQVAMAMTL